MFSHPSFAFPPPPSPLLVDFGVWSVRYEDLIGHSTVICVKLLSFLFDLPSNQTDRLITVLSPQTKKRISHNSPPPEDPLDQFLENNPTSQIIYKVGFLCYLTAH
jgi:hypothetical protein